MDRRLESHPPPRLDLPAPRRGVVLAGNPAFVNAFEGTSFGQAAQAIENVGRALLDPTSVFAALQTAPPAQQLAIAGGYSLGLALSGAVVTTWAINKLDDFVHGRGSLRQLKRRRARHRST